MSLPLMGVTLVRSRCALVFAAKEKTIGLTVLNTHHIHTTIVGLTLKLAIIYIYIYIYIWNKS
jgi:hypothetical protein